MTPKIKELDVVALTADLPAKGLLRGQVGTVVHIPAPGFFIIEFVDDSGKISAMPTVPEDKLMPLHFEPRKATGLVNC